MLTVFIQIPVSIKLCSGYGVGYSWTSTFLEIEAGDTVVWTWLFQARNGPKARVFTTRDPFNEEFDGVGFQSSLVSSAQGLQIFSRLCWLNCSNKIYPV